MKRLQTQNRDVRSVTATSGFSLAELLIVVAITGIITAFALPAMVSQRRIMRSTGITRELMTQVRYARQLAMSNRRAYTFQYDNNNKVVNIIGPIPWGTAALLDANYPNNAGSAVIASSRLAQGGLIAADMTYGIPTGGDLPAGAQIIPTGPLGDGISKTDLANGIINITFQPDGSVRDSTDSFQDVALFLYNGRAAQGTASAISVLGATGRVKIWRYRTNGNRYAE